MGIATFPAVAPITSQVAETVARSWGGGVGPTPVSAGAATLTLSALHNGRTVNLDQSGGTAVTLPAATGTGFKCRLVVSVASNANTVLTLPTTDYFQGVALVNDVGDSSAATVDAYTAGSTSNKLAPTTAGGGGAVGDYIELEDIAAAKWAIKVVFRTSTDPVNPFTTQ